IDDLPPLGLFLGKVGVFLICQSPDDIVGVPARHDDNHELLAHPAGHGDFREPLPLAVAHGLGPGVVRIFHNVVDHEQPGTPAGQRAARAHELFVGAGGALTGRGAGLLVIDDIMKNSDDARTQAVRDSQWEWFTKVAMTRRMGKKLVIIIMTRWHSDDIVGRLTDKENSHFSEEEAKGWKIIN